MADLCKEFELPASQVIKWKRQLLADAADVQRVRSGDRCRATPAALPSHGFGI